MSDSHADLSIGQLSMAVDYKLNQLFGEIKPDKPKDAEYVLAWNSGQLKRRITVARHTDGFEIQTVVRTKKLLAPDIEDPTDISPDRYVFSTHLPYIKAYGSVAQTMESMTQEERRVTCFKQVFAYLNTASADLTTKGVAHIL